MVMVGAGAAAGEAGAAGRLPVRPVQQRSLKKIAFQHSSLLSPTSSVQHELHV
jgi:hypothetical protein